MQEPEAAVDLEADEAMQRAPRHHGGVDRLIAAQPVAAQRREDGFHRVSGCRQVPGK